MKRAISILLTLCMLFTLLPFGALAAEETPDAAEDVVYLDDETIASLQENDAEPVEASSDAATSMNVSEDNPPEVTRAKWLADLVDAYALAAEVADEALPDNCYPDLAEDHEFYRDILVAVHFGLVDVEPGHELEPDAALTRDFAVFSLNQLACCLPEAENYTFSDADDVAYPDAAQVAVEHGWLALSGGKFLPEQAVTEAEAAVMVQAAQDAYAATQVDESHENSIVFNPNVKVVPQGTPADEPQLGTVTITNCPIGILAGDTVAVYITDIPSVYQVETVFIDGEITTITGTPVALSDATMSMDLEGSFDVPLEYASPLEDSDLYYILNSGSQTKSRALAKANSKNLKAIKGSKTIDLGGGVKLKVSFTMPAPELDYSINPASPKVILRDSNASATVTLSKDFVEGMGIPSQVMLVGYKVPGVGSIGIYAYLQIDGSVTLTVTGNLKAGVSYSGGHLSAPMSFNRTSSTITAEATVDAGFKAEISITLIGKKILHGDVYARFGGAMNVRVVVRNSGVTPHKCVGTKQWIYADAGYNVTILLKNYSDSMQLLDLSAFYVVKHYEDGSQVPHCTLDANFDNYITPPKSRNYTNGGWRGWNGVSYGSNWEPIEVYRYTTDEEGNATITGFYGNVSALSIPDQIDGHTVVAIGNSALQNLTQIHAVMIPDTVTLIDNGAFRGCTALTEANLPKSLTSLGSAAFANTALTSVEIPKSLEEAGWIIGGPFIGCNNLKNVTFEQGTTRVVVNLFKGCPGLEEITIPETVTSVGEAAFLNCVNLQKVHISDSCTVIEREAFCGCTALTEANLPKSLTTLDARAFADTALTSVEIPKSLEEAGWINGGPFIGCNNLKNVTFEQGTTRVVVNLFKGCPGLEEITIPETVTSVGEAAFLNCVNLQKVHISDSCTVIEREAFCGCTALTEANLPKSLTTLDARAFADTALTSVEIPKSLEEAGWANGGPFIGCENLKVVTFEQGATRVAANLFKDCPGLEEITIPETVTSVEASAFLYCVNLRRVHISDFCTLIEDDAFSGCTALAEANLPRSLTTLGAHAFANTALTSVEIPKSLEEAGWANGGPFIGCENLKVVTFEQGATRVAANLFKDCPGPEEITIPKTVKAVEASAFLNCVNLKTVAFPDSCTTIGDSAFRNCTSLMSAEIPDSVTQLGASCFSGCAAMETLRLSEGLTEIPASCFDGCSSLQKLVVPEGVKAIRGSAFRNNTSLTEIQWGSSLETIERNAFENSGMTSVVLPNTVKTLGSGAFYNSDQLTSIVISDSVTTMDDSVLKDCDLLTTVVIPNSVETIGGSAFYHCASLEEITIPDSVKTLGSQAFYDCDALRTVMLGSGIGTLESKLFYDCDALTDVTLGSGLKTIRDSVFEHCDVLERIVVPYQVTTIGARVFKDCVAFKEITIPRATTSINTNSFSYPTHLTIYGVTGTTAETVAGDIGATFVAIDKPMLSITLSASELTVNRGVTVRLIPTFNPADFTDEVMWKSSNTSIATVDSDGNVKAVSVGTATISLVGGDCRATCRVTVVQPVTGISLNKTSLSLEGGQTFALTATVNPSNAANKTVAWSSSDETIAAVTPDGVVTALKKGTATITCAAQDGSGVKANCTVTVTNDLNIVTSVKDLQSSHKYANNCNDLWQYTQEGRDSLAVTFSDRTSVEEGSDFIYIYDKNGNQIGKYTGSELAGQTITVPGDTVRIKLVSDGVYAEYGFAVTQVNDVYAVTPLAITSQPQDFTGNVGDAATFSVTATGDELAWQWQYKDVGGSWINADSTAASISVTLSADLNGRQYRCIVTDAYGSTQTSDAATLTVKTPVHTNPFTDVTEGRFFYEPVLWAFYHDPQITDGVTPTTFMPDRICTRAHVVTFLWRANGCPEPKSTTNPFPDVPDGKYYTKAVLWASEQGITTGYDDGTFRPDAECTRGQVVTFLWRANGEQAPMSSNNPFVDVSSSAYYYQAVLWARENGITDGRTPTTFGPTDACTRGHVVTFLYRAYA